MNVDGEDIDIQQIIPMNNGVVVGDGQCAMRWFNSGNYNYATWYEDMTDPDDPSGETGLGIAGWGDDDMGFPWVKTFAPGQWFLVQPTDSVDKPQVEVAGALVSADNSKPTYVMELQFDTLQAVGNPFPTTCDIQAIIPMNDTEVVGDGQCAMRWFNGGNYNYATWYEDMTDPDDPSGETGLGIAGWGDDDMGFPWKKVFGLGEGFLVQPTDSVETPKLAFPNPLYSEKK